MLNKKGQALVEFILILPIFLMILFIIVDFGMIFSTKSSLENASSDIVLLIQNNEDIDNIPSLYDGYDIDINLSNDGKYYNILVKKSVDLFTPGINKLLDDPYIITIKRVVPHEET